MQHENGAFPWYAPCWNACIFRYTIDLRKSNNSHFIWQKQRRSNDRHFWSYMHWKSKKNLQHQHGNTFRNIYRSTSRILSRWTVVIYCGNFMQSWHIHCVFNLLYSQDHIWQIAYYCCPLLTGTATTEQYWFLARLDCWQTNDCPSGGKDSWFGVTFRARADNTPSCGGWQN